MNLQPPQSPPPVDLTGRELGDYRIIRRLGRGGMADVYLSTQKSLNRNIALKILKPELAKDESYVKRFLREAQAAAGLRQTNIVQIHEVGERDGFHFISQEYVQGRNLKQYLSRHGAVEPVMAISVLRQCALALQEAGKQNVIHRDIKPENIMLSTNGEVKITDFGLARVNNDAQKQALTQVGVTMGTPLYMSPEQVEGRSIDQRSDIYSLGVTAYQMLAGRPPFDGDNALSIALQHVKDQAPALSTLRPDVPIELCQLVEMMMEKNREKRPADAAHLIKELRKVKVDIDEDWEMIVEKLSFSDTATGSGAVNWTESQLAATRQLQSVMKGNIRSWWKSRAAIASVLGLSFIGLVGGAVLASRTAPDSLLASMAAPAIAKMDSVDEQWDLAQESTLLKLDEELYYQAVIDLWPLASSKPEERMTTENYHHRSESYLGDIYLQQNRVEMSLEKFQALVDVDQMFEKFSIIGHAGMAIAYDRMAPARFDGGGEEKMRKRNEAMESVMQSRLRDQLEGTPFIKAEYERLREKVKSESESRKRGLRENALDGSA